MSTVTTQAKPILKIQKSYTLPSIELSGLSWLNYKKKDQQLVAVGDREYKIFLIEWPLSNPPPKKLKFKSYEVRTSSLKKHSQWEAVSSDQQGSIHILQEKPGRIYKLEKNMKLEASSHSIKSLKWSKNSGGEGLVVSDNNYFIIKEKNPIEIIQMQNIDNKLTKIKSWSFDSPIEKNIKDASDLTVWNNDFYILSDQKRSIYKLNLNINNLDKIDKLKTLKRWKLPKKIRQPEGLAITVNGQVLVLSDRKHIQKPNLFLLSPL